ncbi:oligopeptide/dipeptide ABC transporter ATP-binding protein [Pseudorhizobium tarimense]|uniref:Oligopeptide/dipeptide ABC transporter ATP-binding protein n=1 Tax=Pseudorhizobium tarimense TaxID=1079109 RepID=A0ABV2HBM0_9HYPH|nr:oligopeptide/dipeptide ABC transporter ATP-binding protein [Pseudorhizobium tarimense]MCJ8520922.1 ATP-binding cassette domain-containing protein [Pseudorhizobium tarimense]
MKPLLEIDDVSVHFPLRQGFMQPGLTLRAVENVTLSLQRGKTLAIVGESGSGKSTLGYSVAGLRKPTSGAIRLNPQRQSERGSGGIQMIFQDPFSALDPRMMVEDIVAEPLRLGETAFARKERRAKVAEVLEQVGLPADAANRYPHQFSGGQRQRIAIARALIGDPELIVCDEPLSALDVSIQSKILNLMDDIREKYGISYFFISHDFGVVRHIADQVAVLYLGRIMEVASADDIFSKPSHPYTQALFEAVPRIGRGRRQKGHALKGEIPTPLNPPSGCVFHTRCPRARENCAKVRPKLEPAPGRPGQLAACHYKD